MKLQPTSSYVLLKDTKKKDEMTDGGIVLPQGSREKEHSEAEILAIGPLVNCMTEQERKKDDVINVGSIAIYADNDTVPIHIGDQTYRIILDSRICAVIS
jgi:co-chaperonin GroES (HSP10)